MCCDSKRGSSVGKDLSPQIAKKTQKQPEQVTDSHRVVEIHFLVEKSLLWDKLEREKSWESNDQGHLQRILMRDPQRKK